MRTYISQSKWEESDFRFILVLTTLLMLISDLSDFNSWSNYKRHLCGPAERNIRRLGIVKLLALISPIWNVIKQIKKFILKKNMLRIIFVSISWIVTNENTLLFSYYYLFQPKFCIVTWCCIHTILGHHIHYLRNVLIGASF